MTQITLDEAREQLVGATSVYKDVEAAIAEIVEGESTPERVLRHVELRGALNDAATALIEAKATFEQIQTETARRRRERAQAQLAEVEGELVGAVAEAEEDMDRFARSAQKVLELAKRRYGHRQEITGRAPRSLLARSSVHGWLTWRLQPLELPDMDNPPHHYRAPLAELLGLNTETEHTHDNGDDQ